VAKAMSDLDSSLNATLYITSGVSCIFLSLMFEVSATILTESRSKTNATLAAYLCLAVGVVSVGFGLRECFAAVPATKSESPDLKSDSIFNVDYVDGQIPGSDSEKKIAPR
jgi:hypothetical protein